MGKGLGGSWIIHTLVGLEQSGQVEGMGGGGVGITGLYTHWLGWNKVAKLKAWVVGNELNEPEMKSFGKRDMLFWHVQLALIRIAFIVDNVLHTASFYFHVLGMSALPIFYPKLL